MSSSAHPTSRLTGGSGNAKAEGDGASISDRGAGGGGGVGGSVEAGSKERMGGLPSTTTTTTSGYAPGQEPGQGGGQASRRVSFQLDAVPHLAARATTAARRCPLQSSCRRSAHTLPSLLPYSPTTPPPLSARSYLSAMHDLPACLPVVVVMTLMMIMMMTSVSRAFLSHPPSTPLLFPSLNLARARPLTCNCSSDVSCPLVDHSHSLA